MTDFLDSNIVLYAFGDDETKSNIAYDLLAQNPIISTQVLNECSHVMRRKLKWNSEQIGKELEILLILVKLKVVDISDIRLAWKISARYNFSHYDSLIIASALNAGCEKLFSEDMQNGQIIENSLKIANPFLMK